MASPSTTPARTRAPWLALAVLCAGNLMIILDGSIVTVALPAIQRELGFSTADLTWTVNAYVIPFGGLLLLAGRLGDLLGRKRILIAGMALFTLASLLCGLAGDPGTLLAARLAQGVGGAMVAAVSLALLVTLFPGAKERGTAIGAFGFVGAAGASIGQVLGGVITESAGWSWIFLINLPIGVAAMVLAARTLDTDRGLGLAAGADVPGAFLVTSGLMLGIFTIVETGAGSPGWARTLGLGALSVALLAAAGVRQATAAKPLLPLRVLRSRTVVAANLVQVLLVAGLFSFQLLIALYLQNVRGYGAAATGLAMLPAALVIGALSLGLSGRLVLRFGERAVLLGGLGLLVGAMGLLTRLPVDAGYVTDLLPTMLLLGGFGLAISALVALGMAGAGPADAGLVSGLFNTTQQLGGALGVAVLTTVATARAETLAGLGHPGDVALTGGFRLAFAVATGLLVTAIAVTAATLRRPARAVGASREPGVPPRGYTEVSIKEEGPVASGSGSYS